MLNIEDNVDVDLPDFERRLDLTMQSYEASLHELLEEARIHLRALNDGNNVASTVGNIGFGPDGGGIRVVSVQGEFVDRLRECMQGEHVLISPMSQFQYDAIMERETQEEERTLAA